MTLLFFNTAAPEHTLEDETFRILQTFYPEEEGLLVSNKRKSEIRAFLSKSKPSLIISREHIPWSLSIPNLVISSSLVYSRFSHWLRSNVSTLMHAPQPSRYRQHVLPPLLLTSSTADVSHHLVSVGPLDSSSNHHFVLDAYSLLPSKIRNQFSLYLCGTHGSQEYIDRLKLHSYGLSIHIVQEKKEILALISQAYAIFRMGNSTQKNLCIDRHILQAQRPTVHFAKTARTSLYDPKYKVDTRDPVLLKNQIRSMVSTRISKAHSSFDAKDIQDEYFSLIQSLQTR